MAWPTLHEIVAASDSVAPALVRAAAGSVAVLGVAGLAALAMRRASAAARHAAWTTGFAGALLLPVLSATLPAWHVLPVRGNAVKAADPSAASPPSVALAAERWAASPASVEGARGDGEATAGTKTQEVGGAVTPAAHAITTADPRREAAVPLQPARRLESPARASTTPPWTAWLSPVWALGTAVVLGRVLLGHLSLIRLQRRCTLVTEGAAFDLLERLCSDLRIRRPVALLTSGTRVMPMTWGLSRARLLVPEQFVDWTPDRRRDVLLHELGHVKRWDCPTQLLAQVACAAYWFNPLAWVAARRMQVERERACDDLVLHGGAAASDYAGHLLASVASVPGLRLAGAAIAMARPSTLEERVRAILDARQNRGGPTARGALAAIALLALALIPAAVLRAQQSPAQNPPAAGGGSPASPPARGEVPETPRAPGSPAATTRPSGATTRPATTRPVAPPGARFPTRGFSAPGGTVPGEGPTCSLDATVYDVRVPADQIGRLDVDALATAAESPEAFEKALAALGTAKPMYRANQSVRLSGDTITIGSEVPLVTNSRMNDKGQMINTVQYTSTGARFAVAGKAGAPGGGGAADVDLEVQISMAGDTTTAVSDKVTAPLMRRATLAHKGPFTPRKPLVLVSVDAGSKDKDGRAVAYIARIILGEPQPPAAGTPSPK